MGNVFRVVIEASARIDAPADALWQLITDWAGMSRWSLPVEERGGRGPALERCELVGKASELPRTRRMFLDNGAVVEERLFHQDDETRRIYYTKSPERDHVGYLATSYVDELDNATCTVHLTSQFDVFAPADPAAVRARYEAVYEMIFRGYQRYFTTARNQ
jgi:hypothetical protein